MITGQVTAGREAEVRIEVRGPNGAVVILEAVVDTGFTEYLTLPAYVIDGLSLPFVSETRMVLAGELSVELDLHFALIRWNGLMRTIVAHKAEGVALIGMGLLQGFRLTVDGIDGGAVTITPLV